jgi:hypothetical protein
MMFLFVLISLVGSAIGWGRESHRDITKIALGAVEDRSVRKFLRDHLGNPDSVIQASVWADSDEASIKYPGSEDLHFSNTPWRVCDNFNISRDCGFGGSGECIVTGIAKMSVIASDRARSPEDRTDALKFLLHLVADIHQPLHTGFAEDNGGNNIRLASDPQITLHQLWDYALLENETAELRSEPAYAPMHIDVPTLTDSKEAMLEYASALATESSTLLTCEFAYRNEAREFIRSKDVLSPEYIGSRKAIVIDRIRLAGERLAQLLTSVARTFYASKPESASPPVPLLRFENRFAVLEVELEPDDLVEESTIVIERPPPVVTEPRRKKQPHPGKNRLDEFIPEAPEKKIGKAILSNVVLIKQNERYILTCANLVRENPNYAPFHVASFRVRFSKNRRQKDPIVFLVDLFCFGHAISQGEFLNVLYYLGGNVGSLVSSSVSVTRMSDKDVLDISPISGEFADRISTGVSRSRFIRGWSIMHDHDNFQATGSYLDHLRGAHIDTQHQQAQLSAARNISLEEMWDRDFFSKYASIQMYRFGRLQIVIHKSTLANSELFELQFAVFGCVSKNADDADPFFLSLIDTNIFDGYITPRISKGLASLMTKESAQDIDFLLRSRPSFLDELHDIDLVLNGVGRGRSLKFKAIKGYYMYPSVLSASMAYIEWTLVPYFLVPDRDAERDSPARTVLVKTSL